MNCLLVAGDVRPSGGMDAANHALALHLARRPGSRLHVVAHVVADDVCASGSVRVHRVPRPFGAHRIGQPLLRAAAHMIRVRCGPDVRAIANGGNADLADVSWVHYVHAAFEPRAAGLANGLATSWSHRRYVAAERAALQRARLVICNSRRTAEDVVTKVGVPRSSTRVVYYGTDPRAFGNPSPEERAAARRRLGIEPDRLLALFAGALGDRRKNFDTLFDAWRQLCARRDWDVDLLVAGHGAELPAWRARAASGLAPGRMRFLGYRRDMATVLAACDVLVHPARYEPYGLVVHEALCRGIPAIASASSGVAERYPEPMRSTLVADCASAAEIARRLIDWRGDPGIAARAADFGARLRLRTWDHMAHEIVDSMEGRAA